MHSRDDDASTHRGRARERGRVDVDTRDRSIRPTSTEGTVNMAPERCLTRAFEDDENEICDGDARGRATKYWLRRRCSTGSHASASTNILGGGVGESSNESDQATARVRRRGATTSSSENDGDARRRPWFKLRVHTKRTGATHIYMPDAKRTTAGGVLDCDRVGSAAAVVAAQG